MTDVTYARLRATDPGRWRAAALAWRGWAAMAGRWTAEFGPWVARLTNVWFGAAAKTAGIRLSALRVGLCCFRLLCWEADQALSEFAAALSRAKSLLAQAVATARSAGLVIDDRGTVSRPSLLVPASSGLPVAAGAGGSGFRPGRFFSTPIDPSVAGWGSASVRSAASGAAAKVVKGGVGLAGAAASSGAAISGGAAPIRAASSGLVSGGVDDAAARLVASHLAAALEIAAVADAAATRRLAEVTAVASASEVPPPPAAPLPPCTATPAQVRRWWDALTPEQRRWLVATEPGWLGPLDGVPAGFRDLANRLLLDDRRVELDREAADAQGSDARRFRGLRHGLDRLAERLADGDGPRAYLLRLDLAEEGRAVVALGDPDRADNVLTHVPGMTADLASYSGELARAERVAVRAAELGPESATSAVMWLDYDAPDFIDEAAGTGRAEAGAVRLRHFQEGLRATHEGPPARQTVLGHSYGSLVVGTAAKSAGLEANSVVFVGSPGVGVDSAARLQVPHGQVWSSTSHSDVIQYTAVSPRSLVEDVALSRAVPVIGPLFAFGRPEDDLWFGRNPSDPAFGAHLFPSQPDGGHLGYWDVGQPALDGITAITLGKTR